MHCEYGGRCGGCPLIQTPYELQKEQKLKHFEGQWKARELPALPTIDFIEVAESGLRDRADLTWHIDRGKARLGLYDLERQEILDLETCGQMSETLAAWYSDFRKVQFPVGLGSLRLRVGPSGQRGVWLDFSNLNVKELFDEENTLRLLLEMGVVEIGQRRKRLVWEDSRLRLIDPVPDVWFEAYLGEDLVSHPLLCSIGDFTQPSLKANCYMMAQLNSILSEIGPGNIFEFGSGIGNFTLPLAHWAGSLQAFERDKYALLNLEANLKESGLEDKVKIHRGDYQRLKNQVNPDFSEAETVFVDPPRSGLKEFIEPLFQADKKPKNFIYVSCFAESFCEDASRLLENGYSLNSIKMIDQFPQSRHYEIMAHFVQE